MLEIGSGTLLVKEQKSMMAGRSAERAPMVLPTA